MNLSSLVKRQALLQCFMLKIVKKATSVAIEPLQTLCTTIDAPLVTIVIRARVALKTTTYVNLGTTAPKALVRQSTNRTNALLAISAPEALLVISPSKLLLKKEYIRLIKLL